MMIVAPIAYAYAVGPTILAVPVLDQHLSTGAAIGAALAIAGVTAVTAASGRAAVQRTPGGSGVTFGVVAMIGFAASAFLVAAFAQRVRLVRVGADLSDRSRDDARCRDRDRVSRGGQTR
ncbi:MAG TPA: hypothetical protein VEC09_08285 [Actinomycetota bacterium]|nr:hypothetical protein [Actinomycetota bacterium]